LSDKPSAAREWRAFKEWIEELLDLRDEDTMHDANRPENVAETIAVLEDEHSRRSLMKEALIAVNRINPEITFEMLERFLRPKRGRGRPGKAATDRLPDLALAALDSMTIAQILRLCFRPSEAIAVRLASEMWNVNEEDLRQHMKRGHSRRPETWS
jgi:hypothetical protein